MLHAALRSVNPLLSVALTNAKFVPLFLAAWARAEFAHPCQLDTSTPESANAVGVTVSTASRVAASAASRFLMSGMCCPFL